jgi:hypothetical protein
MPALKTRDALFKVFRGWGNSMKIVAESTLNSMAFNPKVVFSLEALPDQAYVFRARNSNNLSPLLKGLELELDVIYEVSQ